MQFGRRQQTAAFLFPEVWMRSLSCLTAGLVLLFEPGCGGNSVNKAQYDRLQLGMQVSDIEDILGKGKPIDNAEVQRIIDESLADLEPASRPKIDVSELRGIRWGSDKKNITVIFQNDRLFRRFQKGL